MFDYFSYQFPGIFRKLASQLEKRIMRRANCIIVPNEFLAERLKQRYSVSSIVIHNPNDELFTALSAGEIVRRRHFPNGQKVMLYTGAIYEAHFSVFRKLLASLKELNQDISVRLYVYTNQSIDILRHEGLYEDDEAFPIIYRPQVIQTEVAAIQHEADVLYLPLTNASGYPEIISTSCPGKFAEYLSSGVPILAHIPRHCFLDWYISKYRCGALVYEDSDNHLIICLQEIFLDRSVRVSYVQNAKERAEIDFNPRIARELFLATVIC